MRAPDQVQIDAALSFGASRQLVVTRVLLPSALPMILTGLCVGMGIAWMSVVASEITRTRSGLGSMMSLNRLMMHTENVVAEMVVIGALGFTTSRFVMSLQRALTPWRRGLEVS